MLVKPSMLLKLRCVFIFSDLFSLSSHNTVLIGFNLLYIEKMKKKKKEKQNTMNGKKVWRTEC